MAYMHIDNLYKNTDILLFKRCYALEKIHGTSARVSWSDKTIRLASGGGSHDIFVNLFDHHLLDYSFRQLGHDEVTIYGEFYGGKIQKMRSVYGDHNFVAFEVRVGRTWLSVPNACSLAQKVAIPFVHFEEIDATIEALDRVRDQNSTQSFRNGFGVENMSEGIVVRPLIEVTKSNGDRIIAKHKRDDFRETRTPRVVDPEALKILEDAKAIAFEWVTDERLRHVLDKLPPDLGIESTGTVVKAMIADVVREAEGEIVESKAARKEIGRAAASMFKRSLGA